MKKCLNYLLILFLASILSLIPFYSDNAYSKYSFGFNGLPVGSTNFKEKSLTTHKKSGEYVGASGS